MRFSTLLPRARSDAPSVAVPPLRNTCGTFNLFVICFRDRHGAVCQAASPLRCSRASSWTSCVFQSRCRNAASPVLRRDEGRPRPQVEIRHPPADHGPGGARLPPAPAESGARHRGDPHPESLSQTVPSSAPSSAPPSRAVSPRAWSRAASPSRRRPGQHADDRRRRSCHSIPVMGRIAAGTPVSAIQNTSHAITLSPDFVAAASTTP